MEEVCGIDTLWRYDENENEKSEEAPLGSLLITTAACISRDVRLYMLLQGL